MTGSPSSSGILELSGKIIERANTIHRRISDLEDRVSKDIAPTTRRISKNKSKWVLLHNDFRAFGLILSWQQIFDFHGGAMLRWTTRGHDMRVSVSLSYLETELALTDQISQALRAIGSDPELNDKVALSLSDFAKDMLNAEISGKIKIRGVPFDFTTSLTLLPVVVGNALFLRLGRRPNIYLSGAGQIDRIDIQRKLVGELNRLLQNKPVQFPQATSVGNMSLKSVHTDLSVTLYYTESFPRAPVTRIFSGIDKPATPEGWEDIIVSMTDDYVSSIIRQKEPRIGFLRYEQDPNRPGHWFLRIAVRREINAGGSIDFGWFGSFSWRFNRVSWPEFLFGFRSEIAQGTRLKVLGTFFYNGQKLGEEAVLNIPNVRQAREAVDPGKSYDVRIAFAGEQ